MEMIYRFVFGERSYYDLSSTRHVEPRAMSEEGEEEETTDRHDRSVTERLAIRQSVVCDVTFRERASSSNNLIEDYPIATGLVRGSTP